MLSQTTNKSEVTSLQTASRMSGLEGPVSTNETDKAPRIKQNLEELQQLDNRSLVNDCVLTLMTMAEVSAENARGVWTANGTDILLALLDQQNQNQQQSSEAANPVFRERCAAALEMLIRTVVPDDIMIIDFAPGDMMIDRIVDGLVSQVKFMDESSSHAIRALYNLLHCKWPSSLNTRGKIEQSLLKMVESQDISHVAHDCIMGFLECLIRSSDEAKALSQLSRFHLLMPFLGKEWSLSIHGATMRLMDTLVTKSDGSAADIVYQLCNTLQVHQVDEPIHLVGTSVIHNFLQQTNDAIPPALLQKLVGTVIQTMKAFPHISIQKSAYGILVTLAKDEYGQRFVKHELMISSIDAGKIVLRHKANANVTLHGMATTVTMAEWLNKWKTAFIPLFIALMQEWSGNGKIEPIGLKIFASLLHETHDHALSSDEDCLGVIISGLESKSEVTALQSAKLLSQTIAHDIRATDAFSKVIGCMVKHADSSEIQLQCCLILQRASPYFAPAQIVNEEGLTAITYALECHSGLVELVEPACRVLSKIIDDVRGSSDWTTSLHSMSSNLLWENRWQLRAAAISCMQKSLANTNAARAIVGVWLDLCFAKDDFKGGLVTSVPLLLQAMSVHLHDLTFQTKACNIISLLCDFGHSAKLSRMGTVDSVQDSLLAHGSSTQLVEHAFVALEIIVSEGVASIILDICELTVPLALIHRGHGEIQKHALAMVKFDHINVQKVLKDEVLEWVIEVMRRHINDKSVQNSACLTLKSYLVDPISRKKMKENRFLCVMLDFTSEHFPNGSCGRKATKILEVLRMKDDGNGSSPFIMDSIASLDRIEDDSESVDSNGTDVSSESVDSNGTDVSSESVDSNGTDVSSQDLGSDRSAADDDKSAQVDMGGNDLDHLYFL